MTDALTTLLVKGQAMTRDDLRTLLGLTDPQDRKRLYDAAYEVKASTVGRVDYYLGLLEGSAGHGQMGL